MPPVNADSPDLREFERTARDAADAAAAVHLVHAGRFTAESATEKAASDFVSEVDLEAQAAALAVIRERHPDHRILAEEAGDGDEGGQGVLPLGPSDAREAMDIGSDRGTDPGPRPLWIVDPLDGTTNYLHGHPMYCASVGVTRAGVALAGAVSAPATGERWWAHAGGGAWKSGPGGAPGGPGEDARAVRVSSLRLFRKSLIGTGFPFKRLDLMPEYLRQFDRMLRATSGIRRGGSAALDLCYLADGTFDGFWELWLAPWDIAAGAAILSEAGGIMTRLDGSIPEIEADGSIVAANSPELMAALMTVLEAKPDHAGG